MKRKGILLACIFLLLLGSGLWLLNREGSANTVEIWSDGTLLYTLPLAQEQSFTVDSQNGSNTIEIQNGKIRVSSATCPDHICIHRGACSGGADIICLPNRLVIRFLNQSYDGITG